MATRSSRRRTLVRSGSILALAACATAADAQRGGAHQHGVVKLNLAVDAASVTLQMEAPLDSLVGFDARLETMPNESRGRGRQPPGARSGAGAARRRGECTLQGAR